MERKLVVKGAGHYIHNKAGTGRETVHIPHIMLNPGLAGLSLNPQSGYEGLVDSVRSGPQWRRISKS